MGFDNLTSEEKRGICNVPPMTSSTAGGLVACDKVVMCNLSYLGKRQVYLLKDCPPGISVRSEVACRYGFIRTVTVSSNITLSPAAKLAQTRPVTISSF